MSLPDIGFHRLAFREYVGAIEWYRARSERAANRFIDAVDQSIQKIRENPRLWPVFRAGCRWIRTRKFPYVLYFQIGSEERIVILAVAHGHRRPGYWIRRLIRP